MNSFLVRRVLIVAGLTVPSVGVAQLSACDSMNVPAAFVDLYDPSLMRLASVNQGMTEFFGYPEWTVLDLEGNIVAEETVNFFGLIDTSWHDLTVVNLPDYGTDSIQTTLQLTYMNAEGEQSCEYSHTLRPWTPSFNLTDACVPLCCHVWGTQEPGSGFHVQASNADSGELLFSADAIADSDGGFSTFPSQPFCIGLAECLELEWSPIGELGEQQVWLHLRPAGLNATAWFSYWFEDLLQSPSGSVLLDAYEPNCSVTTSLKERVAPAWDGPNPIRATDAVPTNWRGAVVHDMQGRTLGVVSATGMLPQGAHGPVVLVMPRATVKVVVE